MKNDWPEGDWQLNKIESRKEENDYLKVTITIVVQFINIKRCCKTPVDVMLNTNYHKH